MEKKPKEGEKTKEVVREKKVKKRRSAPVPEKALYYRKLFKGG